MATTTQEDDSDGVTFTVEDDGSITARDLETGLARGGETRAEALTHLAGALTLHEGGGDPIDDPVELLREELDIEPSEEAEELPDFLR